LSGHQHRLNFAAQPVRYFERARLETPAVAPRHQRSRETALIAHPRFTDLTIWRALWPGAATSARIYQKI
jgi:hypothetical protein